MLIFQVVQMKYLICLAFLLSTEANLEITSEENLKNYLQNQYEKEASDLCYKSNVAEFAFETDITNKTKEEITTNVTLESAKWSKYVWDKYFKDISLDAYKDPSLKRQLKALKILGSSILEPEKIKKLTNVTNQMTEIYSTARICPYEKRNCNTSIDGLNLEPGIESVMSKSTNYEELKYVWKSWRDATGSKMRELYETYVDLSNEAARKNNFSDYGAFWRHAYEDDDFVKHIDELWQEVEPLYSELHKYVAGKLKERYGNQIDTSDGLIPAHVFGNMWAQQWFYLADLVRPYPNVTKYDVDAALKKKKYTVLDMFQAADEFYQSLGLLPNGICYNESAGAMIVKPTDGREVLCHASAWDFCDGKNYRIKMCTEVNLEDFITIHHEMGHIQYYLQYKNQPYVFRDGANPGFHEAIGDTIALSVATPKHLARIGLLENFTDNKESRINALMDMALEKVAFLPFGLLIDKWRWDVFNKSVNVDKWNSHWWDYRRKYQKVKPPVERSDEHDFDPGAKFHVAGDSQYIAYFVSHILQFQFYKSLCIAAKQYNPLDKTVPLHDCDYYKSKEAGNILRAGLSLGGSKHWTETLEIMTGTKKISAQPLLEYFEPLYEFLKAHNQGTVSGGSSLKENNIVVRYITKPSSNREQSK